MTDDLLTLVKRRRYVQGMESTNDIVEYNRKKINFKTFYKIIDINIEAKKFYYHTTFSAYKNKINKPSNIDFTFEPTSENDIYNIINNFKKTKKYW